MDKGTFELALHNALVDHISQIPGYDPSYTLSYYNSWSSYEEHGWLAIFERNGLFYYLNGGYSVMCEGPQDDMWVLVQISENQALTLMEEFDHDVDQIIL